MNHVLDNGTALQYFEEMCVLQGVDKDIAKELIQSPKSILPKSKYITDISAIGSGYVSEIDSMVLAGIARSHGAGRFALEDLIVPEIGFEIIVTRGQYLNQGDNWVRVHHNDALTDQQTSSLNSTLTLKSIREKGKSRLIKNIL
jgi:pyrimidine-nucleoside phosphorylase